MLYSHFFCSNYLFSVSFLSANVVKKKKKTHTHLNGIQKYTVYAYFVEERMGVASLINELNVGKRYGDREKGRKSKKRGSTTSWYVVLLG